MNHVRISMELQPLEFDLLHKLGDVCCMIGEFALAEVNFKQALNITGEHKGAGLLHYNYGILCAKQVHSDPLHTLLITA